MFVYFLVDHDANEIIEQLPIQQKNVLFYINKTPPGNITYVVNCSGDPRLVDDFPHMNYDEIMEIIEVTEREGMLVAKFDNDVLE